MLRNFIKLLEMNMLLLNAYFPFYVSLDPQ